MRACVQRVSQASVTVSGEVVDSIERGLVVLLGVAEGDDAKDAEYLAEKICGLRVFEDADGKMNLALADVGGRMLAISQFTLLGDCRRGRRPSFTDAARPEVAIPLYEAFLAVARARGVEVATGRFGQQMEVALVNDGPVTLLLDSRDR